MRKLERERGHEIETKRARQQGRERETEQESKKEGE